MMTGEGLWGMSRCGQGEGGKGEGALEGKVQSENRGAEYLSWSSSDFQS